MDDHLYRRGIENIPQIDTVHRGERLYADKYRTALGDKAHCRHPDCGVEFDTTDQEAWDYHAHDLAKQGGGIYTVTTPDLPRLPNRAERRATKFGFKKQHRYLSSK